MINTGSLTIHPSLVCTKSSAAPESTCQSLCRRWNPGNPLRNASQKFIRLDVEQDAASCGNLDDPLKFKVMEQWPLNTMYAQAKRLFGNRNQASHKSCTSATANAGAAKDQNMANLASVAIQVNERSNRSRIHLTLLLVPKGQTRRLCNAVRSR